MNPTVVLFWDFIAAMVHRDLFKEIRVHPMMHWLLNCLMLGLLIFFIYYMLKGKNERQCRQGTVLP